MKTGQPNVLRLDKSPRYCQAVMVGDELHIGGQCGYNSLDQDVKAQAIEIMGRIDGLLSRAGLSRENVVIAQVFLSDRADYAAFNDIWDKWVSQKALPTRVCVIAPLIHNGCKVEVSVYAVRGNLVEADGE